jgi:hypothetical protein
MVVLLGIDFAPHADRLLAATRPSGDVRRRPKPLDKYRRCVAGLLTAVEYRNAPFARLKNGDSRRRNDAGTRPLSLLRLATAWDRQAHLHARTKWQSECVTTSAMARSPYVSAYCSYAEPLLSMLSVF